MIIYASVGIGLAVLAGARMRITGLWLLGAASITMSVGAYLFAVWGADGIELNRHLLPHCDACCRLGGASLHVTETA